jgi:hypothetical protein
MDIFIKQKIADYHVILWNGVRWNAGIGADQDETGKKIQRNN